MKTRLIIKKGVLIIFSILICFQYGCVENKHKYQAYQDMKDLVLDEYNRGGIYFLFFETPVSNEISRISAIDLQYTLRRRLKVDSADIESFFKKLILGKIILPCEDLGHCFTLSSAIMYDYKKKGFDEFVKIYATYNEEYGEYTIKSTLGDDEQWSIAYYFYLNNIYTGVDCETGVLHSRKDNLMGIPADNDIDWDSILIKEE